MVDSTTDSDDKTISGYVQFLGSEGPGLVCGGELDVLAARVYCASTNEMFLHDMTQVVPPSTTTDAMSIFYRGSIQCTGEEADITECSISMNTIAECPQGLVQHIMCTSCKQTLTQQTLKHSHTIAESHHKFIVCNMHIQTSTPTTRI